MNTNLTTDKREVDTTPSNSYDQSVYLKIISSASNQPKQLYQISSSTESRESNRSIISTEDYQDNIHIYPQIESVFWEAQRESFEDGMDSKFSQKLISFIRRYGQDAIEAITSLIVYEKVNPEVASEALIWIGRMEHPESYSFRRWLLERSLTLSSTRVRDGALLGLASMDDKHSIKYLKEAVAKENCDELKADMRQVLEQLET